MTERTGVLAAVLSSALGGVAAAATRFVIGGTDPITLGALRFGLGFLFLLPIALARPRRWPPGRDWSAVAAPGLLFFAVFFVLFNVSLRHTTAATRSPRQAPAGVWAAPAASATATPPMAIRTPAILRPVSRSAPSAAATTMVRSGRVESASVPRVMVAGALCMALYNVWSRPFIGRSGPLTFTTAGMGVGATALALVTWWTGGFAAGGRFGPAQWAAIGYLGLVGGALVFYLWAFALERTTPTRVASTITVNPVTASTVAALLLGEPIGLNLVVGVAAVFAGIWIASTDGRWTG